MLELFSVGADCATTLTSGASGLSPTLAGAVVADASGVSSNRFSVLALVIWRNMASGKGSGKP